MTLEAVERHKRWIREIRDPANHNAEPERTLRRGKYEATWQLAPIPTGWAWRATAEGPGRYSGTPWTGPEPTRDAARHAIQDNVTRSFLRHDLPDAQPLLDALDAEHQPDLFSETP